MTGGTRRIFVSYRRQDAAVHAGYLAQTLDSLGAGEVFLDVEEMRLGEDFVQRIHYEVGRCDVLMVLMGRDWLGEVDAQGRSRLWDPLDWVHVEIKAALDRQIPVIPILVDGAAIPPPDQLPEPLRGLAYRQGMSLSPGTWRSDVAHLVSRLPPVTPPHHHAVADELVPDDRRADAPPRESGPAGWTAAAAAELRRRLTARGSRVQARVIEVEANGDGTCDRTTVYREGGYPEERTLKGFTRPVDAAIRDMKAEGWLPADAADPMEPVYDSRDGVQRAKGFRMPAPLVRIFAEGFASADVQPVSPAAGEEPEDPLAQLNAAEGVVALVRAVAEARGVVAKRQGTYVSIAPPNGPIALYVHRKLVSIALPPPRAEEVVEVLPGVTLQRKSPATTYVIVEHEMLRTSLTKVVPLALEALDWRTR